jgi:hypothetical protein
LKTHSLRIELKFFIEVVTLAATPVVLAVSNVAPDAKVETGVIKLTVALPLSNCKRACI